MNARKSLGGPTSGKSGIVALGVLIGLALLFGLVRAARLAWVCDDAFISFRYAQNLIRGHGLVYNVGERVEGYTNFLWTLICAAGMRLSINPITLSEVLGVASYAALLLGCLAFWRRARAAYPEGAGLPVTALGLGLAYHAAVFATGGLETMFFTFLACGGLGLVALSERGRGYLLAGAVLTLATLTRPDGAIFYLAALIVCLPPAIRERRLRDLLLLALPGILIYLPYFAWRWHFYGWPLPNTFYAKSAGRPQLDAGFHYLGLFLRRYWIVALAVPAVGAILFSSRGGKDGRSRLSPVSFLDLRAVRLCAWGSLLYLGYIVLVGGDFMYMRLLIPVLPLLLYPIEVLTGRLRDRRWRLPAGAIAALLLLLTVQPPGLTDYTRGVVEERTFYPASRIAEARDVGRKLRGYLEGTDAAVAIYGSQAMLAYYGEFTTVIEAHAGLTDEAIAHLPAAPGKRVGHVKQAPLEYLAQRGVNFVFSFGLMQIPPGREYNLIDFAGTLGHIIAYDAKIMEKLARHPEVRFQRADLVLDDYLKGISRRTPGQLRADFRQFKLYYFDHNEDPERERIFLETLGSPTQ